MSGTRALGDGGIVDQVASAARAETMACARKFSAIAELYCRRQAVSEGRELWSCDLWDAVAAEVGAAQNITAGAAGAQLRYALALRGRLPQVGALFAEGLIGFRTMATIVARTELAIDPSVLNCIDTELAGQLAQWGPMSVARMEQAVDAVVVRHDPAARRRTASSSKSRHLDFDTTGAGDTTALWGVLYATDARALDKRLTAMANAVCSADPRTVDQRRADALGALACGQQTLVCDCGSEGCEARQDPVPAPVVVHVVAETADVAARDDMHGETDTFRQLHSREEVLAEIRAAKPRPREDPLDPPAPTPPIMIGGSVVPPALLTELIRSGRAVVRPLRLPGPDAEPEPRYRPSAALADFIRCRDLTCRFPGCTQPADVCDVDHTIPYEAGGLTHPSNLKCLCRKHHLLKTFWSGVGGWIDRQLPDGTVLWTSPSGATYRTHPGSRLLIPSLVLPTGEVRSPGSTTADRRGQCMPVRRRTRAQAKMTRILNERAKPPV